MVRVDGPLMSIEAHGWLGRRTYYVRGLVHTPYPIGYLNKIHIPYKISAFGLRPFPQFISQYYSHLGWCYQRRRTWHGIVWSAIRPPLSENKKSGPQQIQQAKITNGVLAWKGLTDQQRHVWRVYPRIKHMSGYNLFLRYFMTGKI